MEPGKCSGLGILVHEPTSDPVINTLR